MPLCFATFHANVESDESNGLPHPNTNLKNLRYIYLIELLFRSVNVFHPQSKLYVLSSSRTDLTALNMNYSRLNSEIDSKALMLSRSFAQQDMIRHHDFSTPIVLIDSDILINERLDPIFEQDFDVALTWRASINMPINGGLLILNNRRPEVARKFFDDFVDLYQHKYIDDATWYGDQLALRDICALTYREMGDRNVVEVNGCKILFLPCEQYNFSPEDHHRAIIHPVPQAVVLHFKGNRKRLMQAYWEAHLQTRECRSLKNYVHSYLMRQSLKRKAKHEFSIVANDEDQ
jgi:hypothetical protein